MLSQEGMFLGYTMEGRFHHQIMVPFSSFGHLYTDMGDQSGSYTIDTVVAKA